MSSAETPAAITEDDVAYHRHNGVDLLARVYRPAAHKPRGALVDVHGGAWTSSDRLHNAVINKAIAATGFVVLALDFRLAPAARYPASICDVNLGVRYLKSKALEWGFDAARVGALGVSSGGHQVLLNAIQPLDQKYAAATSASSPHDASVAFAIACWPIADPLARYRMAQDRGLANLVRSHDAYFGGEASMISGNPQLVMERNEHTHLPPLLIVQGTADENVAPEVVERFAAIYGKAGGRVSLEIFPGEPHSFINKDPSSLASRDALDVIVEFINRQS